MSLEEKLSGNKRTVRLLQAVNDGVYSIDIAALQKEVESLHAARRVQRLKHDIERPGKAQSSISKANLQDQAFRSRLVAIKLQIYLKSYKLEEEVKYVTEYLMYRYRERLSDHARSQAGQSLAVKQALEPAHRLLTQYEALEELIDLVIGDIDQAGFSLNRTITTLSLSMARERNI